MKTALPIQHRPFDLAAAKSGAPYATRDGREVTVLKFDSRHDTHPLVGVFGTNDMPCTWKADGAWTTTGQETDRDLVMTPLGYIDGKPVFVGDRYVGATDQTYSSWTEINATPENQNFIGATWPAPAKVYPETNLSAKDVREVIQRLGVKTTITVEDIPDHSQRSFGDPPFDFIIRAIANAALRHAIDAGQVITKDDADAVMAELSKSVAAELSGRAARDMAIAEAVRDACRNNFTSENTAIKVSAAYGRISNVSLEGVIAGVKS